MACCPTCRQEYTPPSQGIAVIDQRLVIGRRTKRVRGAVAALMRALAEANKQVVPTPKLCAAIGERCSKDALKVRVHEARAVLRGTGFEIVTHYGLGYALRGASPSHGEAGR